MENQNNTESKSAVGRLPEWEKPAVKDEYSITELTKFGLPGPGDGPGPYS
tara:strand:- start:196 stop:345 length:150 start_codon:yes stop_codon:yes gene_type:complete